MGILQNGRQHVINLPAVKRVMACSRCGLIFRTVNSKTLGQLVVSSTQQRIFQKSICSAAVGIKPALIQAVGIRHVYQPKSQNQTRNNEVPGYRIGVTKGWDSQHTGNLKGSYWASERMLDDIMVRKFVEGVFYDLLTSDVVIKRRDNRISVVFLVKKEIDIAKFYFLVGFSEKLLTELLGCLVKIEAQTKF